MKAGSRVAGMESKNRVAGVEVGDKAGSRTIGSRMERKTGGRKESGKESGRFFAVLCAAVLLSFFMAGCGKQVQTAGDVQDGREAAEAGTETFPAAENSPVAGKKVAYILNMASSEIFRLCADLCVETAEKLGMSCDVYFSGGDDALFQNYIATCAADGYDGLFVSHGGKDYSYTFLQDILGAYPDLKIVTFDTQFEDSSGQTQKIKGVTQFFQDDEGLAADLLEYLCGELYPGREQVNLIKVWVGPDYIAVFDRREKGYQEYEESGKIHTLEVIGPADYGNVTASMYDVMGAALMKYGEGEVDGIWVAYDAYAQGCYQALKEAGKDIPLVSADICNMDIRYMLEEGSMWKACACTDFRANGEQGIRILALEMNGDYGDIKDRTTGAPVDYIEMPAALITQDMLKEDSTIGNLHEIAPKQYGAVEYYVTNDWLKECIGY